MNEALILLAESSCARARAFAFITRARVCPPRGEVHFAARFCPVTPVGDVLRELSRLEVLWGLGGILDPDGFLFILD